MWADAVSEAATLWYFAAVTAQETHASLNPVVWNSPRDFRILHLQPEYLENHLMHVLDVMLVQQDESDHGYTLAVLGIAVIRYARKFLQPYFKCGG
jgi:hypothetical protein